MDIYGFSSSTLFFLLSTDPLLPIQLPATGSVTTPFTFQNPNNANFQYYFNDNATFTTNAYNNMTNYFNCPYLPSPQYICNPAITNQGNAFNGNFPNWLSTINGNIDLRAFYVTCGSVGGQYVYNRVIPSQDTLGTISSYTGYPVAYTT